MRRAGRILAVIALAGIAMGLLWIGQGAGWIDWPASSFMIDQRPWIARGAMLATAGTALALVSRWLISRGRAG